MCSVMSILSDTHQRAGGRKRDTVAFTHCLLEVTAFRFFVFSQPSVSPDKDLTEPDERLDGAGIPNGQDVDTGVSPLSISSSLLTL